MTTKKATLTIYLDNGTYCVDPPDPIKLSCTDTLEIIPPDGTGGTPKGCILCFDLPFCGQNCWPLSDAKTFAMTKETKSTHAYNISGPCDGCHKERKLLGAHSIQVGD
jgi:hypothetical protein